MLLLIIADNPKCPIVYIQCYYFIYENLINLRQPKQCCACAHLASTNSDSKCTVKPCTLRFLGIYTSYDSQTVHCLSNKRVDKKKMFTYTKSFIFCTILISRFDCIDFY